MILLGVTAGLLHPDPQRAFFSAKTLCFIEADLAAYLARDGVIPVLIPALPESVRDGFLAPLQGFVLQGGADISPESYGHPHLDAERWPGDKRRDELELAILAHAKQTGKPVLGICRGCQLLNVFCGGTLYQDIPSECPQAVPHRDQDRYDALHHGVTWKTGSFLSAAYGQSGEFVVNSVHHQALQSIPDSLDVVARSSGDNLPEAICFKDSNTWCAAGVQWHPEFSHILAGTVVPGEPLLDWFIKQIRQRQKA